MAYKFNPFTGTFDEVVEDSTQISASSDTPSSALAGDIKLHIEEDTGTLYFMNNDDTKIWSLDTDSYINLNFNITGFSDSLSPTFLIKAPGQSAGSIRYDLTLNNPQSSTFTGEIALSGKVNASQGGNFPLEFNQSNCTDNGDGSFTMTNYNEGSTINLLHPDADASDAWSSGIKTITSTVTVDDGTGDEELTTSINFKNKKFYGYTTATDPTAGDFNVYSLQSSAYVTTSYTQSEVTIVTSADDNYVYYAYPSRITGTPTFKVNGFTTTFSSVGEDKVNQASNGYTEEYKIWKSPQFYNDATLTFEVT